MKYLILAFLFNFLNLAFAQTFPQNDSTPKIEWLSPDSEEMEEFITILEGKYEVVPSPQCDSVMPLYGNGFDVWMELIKHRNVTVDYYGRPTFFHKVVYGYGYLYEMSGNWLIECRYKLKTK